MNRDRIIQFAAASVMLICTLASGVLLPGLLDKSDKHALRYTDISVDGAPPFVALGTAIGALRGLIVDYLWIKVHIMKDKGLFYEVMADSELITKLQPRFAAVWAFHGHNMAYNISVATGTEIERWEWVNAGIRLVRNEGLRYNPNDLQLHRELAFWFAHKIDGVADDAHLYYKTEFCREWHEILGTPPDDFDDRIAWMEKVANAPETLAKAEERTPGVKQLVEDLKAVPPPFRDQTAVTIDRDLLRMWTTWNEVQGNSAVAQIRGLLDQGLQQVEFKALHELASDPARAEAWDTLLAYVRKKVLRDEYNMDPRLMHEYTKRGPIDWRHAQSHALYWSRRGTEVAERRMLPRDDDIYKVINNDRVQIHAMQALARSGRIEFDYYSDELPARLSEPRWVDAIDEQFEALYIKHYTMCGAGGEGFIGFYQNFMSSMIREWYRAGEIEKAQAMMDKLNKLFGTGQSDAIGKNPDFLLPLDVFVKKQTWQEYEFQPHIAPSEVAASLRYGFVNGLGTGRTDVLERARGFAAEVTQFFKGNRYNDYVNRFGRGRMSELLGQLDDVEKIVFRQIMADRSIPLERRMIIWSKADQFDATLRRYSYDRVKPLVERELTTSHFGRKYTIDQVLPEPPMMEQYRIEEARLVEERARQMQEARDRDEAGRGGK